MIESGQISEKDPVQNQLQNVHKATTKKIRGTSTRTKSRKITVNYAPTRSKEIDRAISKELNFLKEIDRAIVDKELKFSKEVDRATVNKELQRKLKAFTRSQR